MFLLKWNSTLLKWNSCAKERVTSVCNDMESSSEYINYKNQSVEYSPIVYMQNTCKCACMEYLYTVVLYVTYVL